jgi:hypothetical protein
MTLLYLTAINKLLIIVLFPSQNISRLKFVHNYLLIMLISMVKLVAFTKTPSLIIVTGVVKLDEIQ